MIGFGGEKKEIKDEPYTLHQDVCKDFDSVKKLSKLGATVQACTGSLEVDEWRRPKWSFSAT